MSKTPFASKKLAQARFFLHLLHAENQKVIGKESLAVEAYLKITQVLHPLEPLPFRHTRGAEQRAR